MEKYMRYFLLGFLLFLAGCNTSTPPTPGPENIETGLQGVVVRGPTQPVCIETEPCDDEPFAASFEVQQDDKVVSSFTSDEGGKFLVYVQPGVYTIVPGDDAPILFPTSQVREVEVLAGELTTVTLSFDTGIQ
ncbi:MAG: hypothetical protein ACRCYY_03840 [Trueperaceae bacterium]